MASEAASSDVLLDVRGLSVTFQTAAGPLRAAEDVSFAIRAGEVFALVGESGSGKSTVALALVGLLPPANARIDAGEVRFAGRDLVSLAEPAWRMIRGGSIGTVFQDPMTSLNPTMTIGEQIAEPLRIHKHLARAVARDRALEMLERVGIPQARQRIDDYPHQ
ncbi:MAG: ABC transporter ATP-binding protein, partial [Alphaproteobacteria bacterium]|nr:ABC transporter ATP-binding protein [Alphaproteobacteria bacterium]